MTLKTFKPYTKSTRSTVLIDRSSLWKGKPFKSLTGKKRPSKGRNNADQVTFYRNVGNQGLQFSSVGGYVYTVCKKQGLGKEIPTEWFLQDIRD